MSEAVSSETIVAPAYQLYSPAGVTWATALGSPAAGGVVMALNYKRLGEGAKAWKSVIFGVLITAALIAIGFMLPANFPPAALTVPQIIGAYQVAKQLQGKQYEKHIWMGGQKASNWKGVGIGVLGLILVVAGIAGYLFASGEFTLAMQDPVVVGKGPSIYYVDGATREQATRLGELLEKENLFQTGKQGMLIVSEGKGKERSIGFILNDGTWDNGQTVEALRQLTEHAAPAIGGKPVVMRMLNGELEEKKRVKIE